jgi:hypothetical protein
VGDIESMSHLPVGGRESAAKRREKIFVRELETSRRKNNPRQAYLLKGWEIQPMGKARQAGALYEGKTPCSSQENPKVAGSVDRKVFGFEQRKGNVRVETPLMLGEERESLRG